MSVRVFVHARGCIVSAYARAYVHVYVWTIQCRIVSARSWVIIIHVCCLRA